MKVKYYKDEVYPIFFPDDDYGDEYDLPEELVRDYNHAMGEYFDLKEKLQQAIWDLKKNDN